jgi:hypothetical protein
MPDLMASPFRFLNASSSTSLMTIVEPMACSLGSFSRGG